MEFNIPADNNTKLEKIIERIKISAKMETLFRMCNVTAIDRLGFNDHGPTHVRITANSALRILRILVKKGIPPSCVENYGLSVDDAEVITVLGVIFHDIGHVVHRDSHEIVGLIVAQPLIKELIEGMYDESTAEIVLNEVLHIIYSHEPNVMPLTIEAGVAKVADALDMEKGRSRIPYTIGSTSIHAISAAAVDDVIIEEGQEKPIKIIIRMENPAGIFQAGELFLEKLETSTLKDLVEVDAIIVDDGHEKHVDILNKGKGKSNR